MKVKTEKKLDKILIDLNELSIGKVIIDDKNISNKVEGITMFAKAGKPIEINLSLISGIEIKIKCVGKINKTKRSRKKWRNNIN